MSDDESVAVYLSRADARRVADLLDAYGDEEDVEIAANIRYQTEERK